MRAIEREVRDDGELNELRIESLRLLLVVILGLAYAGIIGSLAAVPSSSPPPWWDPLPLLVGLTLTGGSIWWLLRSGPFAATLGLVVGLTVTLSALVVLHPGSLFAGYYFLIVLAATGAYDWRTGLVAAVTSSAILGLLAWSRAGDVPADLSDQSLLWVWLTFALAWLPTRPLRSMIHWAWSSYQLAQHNAEEARLRQGELGQVSKSLSEACERLERLNRELWEAKEGAEAARRLKAEFAATVGHELRTPINLIVGFTHMIASPRRGTYYGEPLPACYHDDLQTVYQNARHVSSLVDDILDLSQIDAHRMALHKEAIDLLAVAREAAATVQPLYAEAGLYLSVDVPDDLPPVTADPVRVRQVVINLLYNAVRFTRQGGVVVTAYLTDADLVLAIHDTGVGIPAESLGRVFDEFRQINDPLREHSGSGLGLAVCKRFVELHGGSIWAESELDFGTTIFFSLPLHANVASAPFSRQPALSTIDPPPNADVVVFDETGEAVKVLQRYLDGYRVHRVTCPEQAARLAHRGRIRAMIVTGGETEQVWYDYQRLNPELRDMPTLVCPLRTRQTIAHSLNTFAYLTKPVSRDQLARALRALRRPLRRIVVVEDNSEMRALLLRMLRSIARHAEVVEATDGLSGLRAVRERHPDVVILDLLMPGADGYSVVEAMRNDPELESIPVVVVSARGPNEEVLVGMIGVSRPDGMSVGEAMAYLKADLDTSLRPH